MTDVRSWARRARALIGRTGLSAAAIGRALDMPTATVQQRLRRHAPPTR